MIAICGKTNKGLEELNREEALELVERLLIEGANVQGESVREFAKNYDIYMPDPKDNLTHSMVHKEMKRLYDFGVAHYNMPPAELLDCGEVNDLVGFVVIGEYDNWGFEIGYDIDDEVVDLADVWGLKGNEEFTQGIPRVLADIKRIAFKG
jgi:hypothetical protein